MSIVWIAILRSSVESRIPTSHHPISLSTALVDPGTAGSQEPVDDPEVHGGLGGAPAAGLRQRPSPGETQRPDRRRHRRGGLERGQRRPEEGREVFRQLQLVTDRFLDIRIEYLGYVLYDEKVTKGVKNQKIVSELYPDTQASRCFRDLARKISAMPPAILPKDGSNLFLRHLGSD